MHLQYPISNYMSLNQKKRISRKQYSSITFTCKLFETTQKKSMGETGDVKGIWTANILS
jgi:hypothetical protein